MNLYASYLDLDNDEWMKRLESAMSILENCVLCPRRCGINRLKDKRGYCKVGRCAIVNSFFPHRGEEFPIRGFRGSGTVFFSWCNMSCIYCQNYQISQMGQGREMKAEDLAEVFLTLQRLGCHNINLVTPSHVVPQILESLHIAVKNGLSIPIVYNTSSYDSLESLKLLDSIVDIYLPDLKYSDNDLSWKYSKVKDYWDFAREAISEMYRQVGNLKVDDRGIAIKGLLVRHLILPNGIAGTEEVVKFLSSLDQKLSVNIMDQYYPCYKAHEYPELSRSISVKEYYEALHFVRNLNIVE